MIGALPSPAFRIRQGQTCAAVFWSNSLLHGITGTFHVIYDDGTEDDFGLNLVASGGSVQPQLVPTKRVARLDGYVTSMYIGVAGSSWIQRGQCYAIAYLLQGGGLSSIIDSNTIGNGAVSVLAQGYVFSGHGLQLGVYIEAGPAGGPGRMLSVDLLDPAANADYGSQSVPVSTLWRLQGFAGTLVTDANAANRNFRIDVTDGTVVVGAFVAGFAQSASLTTLYRALGVGSGAVFRDVTSNIVAINIPLGDIVLPWGFVITFVTANMQVTDNWGDGQMVVESWVMPS